MKQRSVHLMNENCSTTRVYLLLESSSRSRSKMSALAEMLTWQGKKKKKQQTPCVECMELHSVAGHNVLLS